MNVTGALRLVTVVLVVGVAAAGCGGPAGSEPADGPEVSHGATVSTVPRQAPTPTGPVATRPAGGGPTRQAPVPVVVLDPGHNGANASHPARINRPVPAGRGRTKPCNTTGTATDAGYPEHAFTFDVASRVRDLLTARGVRVVLTRPDDTGVGPCVDERAMIGNEADALAVVSIHADGTTDTGAHGFHVSYPAPPLNDAQGEPSRALAVALRDAMTAGGFAVSSYLGDRGLFPRDDLGGLNLSERPAVLVECGNMRNPAEAAAFTDPAGRRRYAAAIAAGILAAL